MSGEKSEILYGWDETPAVVSASVHGDEDRQFLRLYMREDGKVRTIEKKFEPFLLLAREEFLTHLEEANVDELSGGLDYGWIARFPALKLLERAKRKIDAKFRGEFKRVSEEYLYISDPVQQGLMVTGVTHFRGAVEGNVVRMQIDIETDTSEGFEFPSAEREGDEIIIIALTDSTGRESVLSRRELEEAEMLARLSEMIREWDPDVIEGHNIFNFDLPYIEARAARHGVKLSWGRDGSALTKRRSRVHLAERRLDYEKYKVEGRVFVDTYILVQFYDLVKREMPGYGLKSVARYLGVSSDDRTYVAGSEIRRVWRSDPGRLTAYALDDVRETGAISAMLSAPYFHQAGMLPFSYQDVYVRGNAAKINSLLVRWYLRKSHSVPKPKARAGDVVGGFTDVRAFGVIPDVVSFDVASLYPSLMLTKPISPATDELGAFLELLRSLTEERLEAKRKMVAVEDVGEKKRLDNKQGTLKILINSFFGYLGADGAYFGDGEAANDVTSSGQEMIKRIVGWLEGEGCRIIEVDTDGVYFNPPREGMSDAEIEELSRRLNVTMPEGISVEVDGRFPAMLSYKVKNYALLRDDGEIVIKGSGMKSRGLEKFQRDFIGESIRMILLGKADNIDAMYEKYRKEIEELKIPLSELSKTERLVDPLHVYKDKVAKSSRGRKAGYELAIESGREFRPGDYVTYYITGEKKSVAAWKNAKMLTEFDPEKPDVNIPYYLAKLADVFERVKGFTGGQSR